MVGSNSFVGPDSCLRGDCVLGCGMFAALPASTPGPSRSPGCDNQAVCRHCPMSPGAEHSHWVRACAVGLAELGWLRGGSGRLRGLWGHLSLLVGSVPPGLTPCRLPFPTAGDGPALHLGHCYLHVSCPVAQVLSPQQVQMSAQGWRLLIISWGSSDPCS